MARPCNCGAKGQLFTWTSTDGKQSVQFTKEQLAKARKMRQGGDYEPKIAFPNG